MINGSTRYKRRWKSCDVTERWLSFLAKDYATNGATDAQLEYFSAKVSACPLRRREVPVMGPANNESRERATAPGAAPARGKKAPPGYKPR